MGMYMVWEEEPLFPFVVAAFPETNHFVMVPIKVILIILHRLLIYQRKKPEEPFPPAHCFTAMSSFLLKKIIESLPYKKALTLAAFILSSTAKTKSAVAKAEAKAETPISGWEKVKVDFDAMLRLLRFFILGEYKPVTPHFLIKILAGVVYFLFITDLIPDIIPIAGFADDIAVLSYLARSAKTELDSFRQWESHR